MTLIAIPLEAELRVLRRVFEEGGIVPGTEAVLIRGGHGKAEFAARCAWELARNPGIDRLIVAGTAGALSPELGPGDIVIATEVVEHDYRERFDPRAGLPRFAVNQELSRLLHEAASRAGITAQGGAIAGGDEDVVSPERARDLVHTTGAIAVAWESPGGARAARVAGVPWCEVRGISDGADGNAPKDFVAHLDRAIRPVAAVIRGILSRNQPIR